MKIRSIIAVLLVVAMGAIFAADVMAQTEVSIENRSFAWTGKSGQNANYRWSATVNNPSSRELNLRVTVEFLGSDGAVIGQSSADVMSTPMGGTPVQQTGNIAFATAQTIAQYRIVLVEIE